MSPKTVVTALCTAMLGFSPCVLTGQSAPPYEITDIRGHLFYSETGTFSPTVIGRTDLWNTIIGEGGSGGASTAALIVIEVSGKPESFATGRRVRLTVSDDQKEIFRQDQAVSSLSAQGHAYVAFWLYDTGCAPLRLSAVLLGQPNRRQRPAKIPFACGE